MQISMYTSQFHKEIVTQYKSLYRYALMLSGNTENAKDLVQETILKALLYQDKFKMDTNLCAWLYTIMKNIFINDYRHIQRMQLFQSIDRYCLEMPGPLLSDEAYDIRIINRIISELEKTDRTIFTLYLMAYKYEEIGAKLHIPTGTVKSRIFYIRKKLQKRLKDFRP